MTPESIINDKHSLEFLNSRQITESTKAQYLQRMSKYCTFLNKTPTELIEEAEDQRVRMKNRQIKKYLNDFLHERTDEILKYLEPVLHSLLDEIEQIIKKYYPNSNRATKEFWKFEIGLIFPDS